MKEIIKQLLTGKDNTTHDLARWLALGSSLVGIGLQVFVVVVRNQPFDLQAFGIGMGAIFTALGMALKLKENSEPEQKQ